MIELTIGTTTNRTKVIVTPDTTLREALEDAEIGYATSTVLLDGANIKAGDMDRSFSDFGITTKAMLMAIVKTENA